MSSKSFSAIAIGLFVIVASIIGVIKYLNARNDQLDAADRLSNNKIIAIAVVTGIILSVVSVVLYRKLIIHMNSQEILTDNFYS
jgi:heme/copper-type cytochrome/quinol oxidase subunit 2